MSGKLKKWPKKNLMLGITAFIIGLILFASKPNPKNEASTESLKRAAYIFMSIGVLNIIIALICYILHPCSDNKNRPRNSNSTNTTQIEPSVHVIAIPEPVIEDRRVHHYNDAPPSYEDAMKNSSQPPGAVLPMPSSYNLSNNYFSHPQVLPSYSSLK